MLRQALILSAKRDYVQAMREGLRSLGDEKTRIDVEMDALRAMQLAPGRYDLIVLDAVMEAMDGLQLLLLLKLQAPSTQFVVVSDTPGEEARAQAYQNGADFYLMRPASEAACRNGIQNIGNILQRAQEARRPRGVDEPVQRLADLVQTRCLSGDSVMLHVQSQFQAGDIFIHRGEVYHAQYPGKSGLAAFHDMSHWDDGLMRVQAFPLTNIPPRTIEFPYRALLEGVQAEHPFASDLRPPPVPVIDPEERVISHDATREAPPLTDETPPTSPFLPDQPRPGATEMPRVESYWKMNLMGDLVEGTRVADAERSALITTFLYRKLADIAVALEVDYFNTLVLLGPNEQQVLVADNLGVTHALLDARRTTEAAREQFVEWCREQSL
jgi:CheY-like chemotaxis protein